PLTQQGRMLRLLRPWTHKAHISAQDIDRLRQLVEMEAPKQAPDPGDSRIVGIGLTLVTRTSSAHGPQLEDFERLPVSAQSRLPVKYGPAVLQFDGQREERKKNGEGPQRHGRRGDV